MAHSALKELCDLSRSAATLGSIGSLLSWDQETYMPPAAAAHRAEQQAMMAALVHERRTSPRIGDLIASCESDRSLTGDPASPTAAMVREFRREYDLATKLPGDLVAELARTGSQAQEVWKEARQKSDFAMFAPWLEKMMALARRKADCYGIPKGPDAKPGERYDALLNEYEPGMTARELDSIFTPLRQRLSAFIAQVAASTNKPSTAPLSVRIDASRQHVFGQFVIDAMGFDLKAGRLDVTTHPFCSGMAPGDTRLTTRYRDEKFTDALYGTMHEAGHGLYEQGLPKQGTLGTNGSAIPLFGTPLSESISLGIHESQSRMWENLVGRSRAFWEWALPHARRIMGDALAAFTAEDLFRAVNTAQPSFIRVEADEATYNMHVMVRFEIERALLSGDLQPRDVPAVWNRKYKDYLGVDVPDDRRGCLQDVHWSFGLIGYFPTYTLGNLYASQFWQTIQGQIGDIDRQIARGEFKDLKAWLNRNIHAHGRRYRAADLCKMVTGSPLSAEPFIAYLEGKVGSVYGIK
ncbi:MAG: carboxypeptidase M32 [Phycisphaeraceae bacterium]|nr:carboxypeptidase M32 [Phycisphaeraceae bacterium]